MHILYISFLLSGARSHRHAIPRPRSLAGFPCQQATQDSRHILNHARGDPSVWLPKKANGADVSPSLQVDLVSSLHPLLTTGCNQVRSNTS